LNDKAVSLSEFGETKIMIGVLCDVLKLMGYRFYISCANTFAILCPVDILYCLLNCITETTEVREGRRCI